MYQDTDCIVEDEISIRRGSRAYSKIYFDFNQVEVEESKKEQKRNVDDDESHYEMVLESSVASTSDYPLLPEWKGNHPLHFQLMDITALHLSIEQHLEKLKEHILSITGRIDAASTYKIILFRFFNLYEYTLRHCRECYPELKELLVINRGLSEKIKILIARFEAAIELPQRNSILLDLKKLYKITTFMDEPSQEGLSSAKIAIPGEGVYFIDDEIARILLCRDRYLGVARSNATGAHAVAAYAGGHYKPNSSHIPITPGAELIAYTLGQLLADQHLIVTPSTAIKVSDVSMTKVYTPQENSQQNISAYKELMDHCFSGKSAELLLTPESPLLQQLKKTEIVYQNTIQTSLTIEGITLQNWLGITHTIMELQTLLGKDILAQFLEQIWTKQALLKSLFLEYPQLSNEPLIKTIFEVWSGYMAMVESNERLSEFKDLDKIPPYNRLHQFQEVVYSANSDRLLLILATLKKYPAMLSYGKSLGYLSSIINYLELIEKLYPDSSPEQAIEAILNHYDKVNLESYAYLSILSVIMVMSDWKPDNIIVQIERDAVQKIKQFHFVGIDNDKFTTQLYGFHQGEKTVNLRCILFCLSNLMEKPIPSSVLQRLKQYSSAVFVTDWLYSLYHQNKNYTALKIYQHFQEKDCYESGFKILDVPIELPLYFIDNIQSSLSRIERIFNEEIERLTMDQFLYRFNPLVHRIYKALRTQYNNPLDSMSEINGHYGITLVKDIIPEDISLLEEGGENDWNKEDASLTPRNENVDLEKSICHFIQNQLFAKWDAYEPGIRVILLERLFSYYPFAFGLIKEQVSSLSDLLLFQVIRCARLDLLVSLLNCYNLDTLRDIQNPLGQNLLHEACQVYSYFPNQKAWDVIRFLVEYDTALLHQTDNNDCTPVFGLVKGLQFSELHEKRVGIPYAKNQCQLSTSAWYNRFLFLYQHGADLTILNQSGYTLMHCAGQNGLATCVEALFNFKVDPEVSIKGSGARVLHTAARQAHAEVVEILLKNKVELFATTAQGETVLHCACQYGSLRVVETVLSCLSQSDKQQLLEMPDRNDGKVALHCAVFVQDIKLLHLLLEAGANAAARNNCGYTALHFAAKMGYMAHVHCLIQSSIGQKLHTFENSYQQTAAQLAERFTHDSIAFYLLEPKLGESIVELHNYFAEHQFELETCQILLSTHYEEWFNRDFSQAGCMKVAAYFILAASAQKKCDFYSAAKFYNVAAFFAQFYHLDIYQGYIKKRIEELPHLWRYQIDRGTYEVNSNFYTVLKEELAKIRSMAFHQGNLEELNVNLIKLITRIINLAEKGIPKLPSELEKYKITWMALGGLKLRVHNSIQPLQFAILIEANAPKEIIKYCQYWIDLFCLHLINIGETSCRIATLRSPIDSGFTLCHRGFYPRGIIFEHGTPQLLATPAEIASLQTNPQLSISHRYALRAVNYLYGSHGLYDQYTNCLEQRLRFVSFLEQKGTKKRVRPEVLRQTYDDLLPELNIFIDKYNDKRSFSIKEIEDFLKHGFSLFQQIIISVTTCFALSPNKSLYELIRKLKNKDLVNSRSRDQLLILRDSFIKVQLDFYISQKINGIDMSIDAGRYIADILRILLPLVHCVKSMLMDYNAGNRLNKDILYNGSMMYPEIEITIKEQSEEPNRVPQLSSGFRVL